MCFLKSSFSTPFSLSPFPSLFMPLPLLSFSPSTSYSFFSQYLFPSPLSLPLSLTLSLSIFLILPVHTFFPFPAIKKKICLTLSHTSLHTTLRALSLVPQPQQSASTVHWFPRIQVHKHYIHILRHHNPITKQDARTHGCMIIQERNETISPNFPQTIFRIELLSRESFVTSFVKDAVWIECFISCRPLWYLWLKIVWQTCRDQGNS